MSANLVRSRLLSRLSKQKRLFSANTTAEPPKEPLVGASSIIAEHSACTPPPPPPAAESVPGKKKSFGFLKFTLFGALTGVTAAVGYATYAYSLDEIDEKMKGLRFSNAIDSYLDLRRSIEEQVKGFTEPSSDKLLPDLHPQEQHVFTLVLDLNETLLYSDWKRDRGWRTFKRPGVDAFLEHLAQFYEIVVYSDELSMYVDPVVERLDQKGCIRYRLSRAATKYQDGKHYRDLSKLNRDPAKILYVSGRALESTLQPENAVPIPPWKVDMNDTALLDLIPFLEYVARHRPADIRPVLASYEGHDIGKEFIERSKEHQKARPMRFPATPDERSEFAHRHLRTEDFGVWFPHNV
ncbi:FCP1 homology domain [Dillenia turbinata]|uniref:Mitochondrial import inner membrane translocase subunit TIM50 n=1 Tax=Dillenia turbinata TaxID=194707 RepID=A0AAN8ZMG4_9MAGN